MKKETKYKIFSVCIKHHLSGINIDLEHFVVLKVNKLKTF